MLTLVTTNPSKYAPFQSELERLRIELRPPPQPLSELQSFSFPEALAAKAKAMAALCGRPVLVDDAGLVLHGYRPFPGPLTSVVIRSLGAAGLDRLLTGVSKAAVMECHIGCWIDGALKSWSGSIEGHIDPLRQPRDPLMPLSDLFVPNAPIEQAHLLHRARALAALETDALNLHLTLNPDVPEEAGKYALHARYQCPFCAELEGEDDTVFRDCLQGRLASRIIYEDDDFVLMPPLGEFIEGGLLLLTRAHTHSMAYLGRSNFARLEQLLRAIQKALIEHWGVAPLIFEHGSALDRSKGHCCVDHAHFNIFPANVAVHPHLQCRMNLRIGSLTELARLRRAEYGYLFVQENDGTRHVYDGHDTPTQLVRRIITTQIGLPDRWHWRDYPGCDELVATYKVLKGQIVL
jgi:XTP/dITP diphosphohydrolase